MKKQIIEFYNDPDFQRLNSYYNRTTIFNILSIERRELSHSAFLKWLFDINGSHNLNDEPLKKLLRHIANADDCKNILNETEKTKVDNVINAFLIGDYTIKDFNIETEKSVVGCENKGRIDFFANFGIFKKKDENNKNTEEKELKENIVLVIENKIDASESNNQTMIYSEWVKEKYKGYIPILIFLNPNGEYCSSNEFITISYQDILEYVIEPLLNMETNDDTKIILEDYIVNLGQPKKQIDDNGKMSNLETILAVSKKNKKTFSELLMRYEDLLNSSMVAYYNKKGELKNIFRDTLNNIRKNIKDNNCESLLSSFWDTNKMLLRIIYLYGKEFDNEDENEGCQNDSLKKLFDIKASNRDNVKYIVINNNGVTINETDNKGNVKAVPKSIASFYIFKAWAEQNPNATLSDLRNAFPVNECASHYEKVYQYLFYEYDAENRIKYTDDTEKFPERAYIEWDFYKGDLAEKYHLVLNGVKVMTLKFWSNRKVGNEVIDDFKTLSDYAEKHYGIKTEKA